MKVGLVQKGTKLGKQKIKNDTYHKHKREAVGWKRKEERASAWKAVMQAAAASCASIEAVLKFEVHS